MRLGVLLVLVAACTTHEDGYLDYEWDGRQVLCSTSIDDIGKDLSWSAVDKQLKLAAEHDWVVMFHAHTPGVTISRDAIERVLSTADADGLDFITFRDLVPEGPRRAGLALAFDDNAPDQWFSIRDLLDAHDAHVTFFVARYTQMTPEGQGELAQLSRDGHDLEPHSVSHIHAPAYVEANGIAAYIDNEVLPSFQVLIDAGFPPPTAYAYPFGEHDGVIDRAVLAHVAKVRTTVGECPW